MPAPLRIILTPEEDYTLSELRQAPSVPKRTRDRAHMLRLNAQGWNAPAIANIFECHQHTVRAHPAAMGRKRIRRTVGSPGTGSETQVARIRLGLPGRVSGK